ncbi:Uncharacterised protein [Serratia fonticola]|nr:Uncharacterised protein [Serratia fonticola]
MTFIITLCIPFIFGIFNIGNSYSRMITLILSHYEPSYILGDFRFTRLI